MLSEREDELLDGALAILSEHFPNYAVAVLSEEGGDLHYDYSNWRIGRMLLSDSLEDMNGDIGMDFSDFEWDEEEDEGYE
jgi:hypothetical protein